MSQKGEHQGNSLVLQWLGLCTFTTVARVQSPASDLRYYKLYGKVKKKVWGGGMEKEMRTMSRKEVNLALSG